LDRKKIRRHLKLYRKVLVPMNIANISYTSGTTADPKGIMLSHLNYATNVIQANTVLEISQDYKTLALLPWDHSFAHTACLYTFMLKEPRLDRFRQDGRQWKH